MQLSFAGPSIVVAVGSFGLKLFRVHSGPELSVQLAGERRLRKKPSIALFSHSAFLVLFARQSGESKTQISGFQLSETGMIRLPGTEIGEVVEQKHVRIACPYRRVLVCIAIPRRQAIALYRVFKDAVDCVAEVHMPGFAEPHMPLHMSCTSHVLIFHAANGDASAVMDPLNGSPVAPPLPMGLPDCVRNAKASNPEGCSVTFPEPDVAIIKAPSGEGAAFRLSLNLEALYATSTDLPLLMSLLQRRSTSGARSLSLKALKSVIHDSDEHCTRKCLSTLARAHATNGPAALEPKVVCEEVLKPMLDHSSPRATARRVHHAAVEYASLLAHLATASEGVPHDCPSCVWEVAILAASHYSPGAAEAMAAESPAPAPKQVRSIHPKLAARSARAYGGEQAARCLVQQSRPIAALKEVRKVGKRVHVPLKVLQMAETIGPIALCSTLRFATLFCGFKDLERWIPNVLRQDQREVDAAASEDIDKGPSGLNDDDDAGTDVDDRVVRRSKESATSVSAAVAHDEATAEDDGGYARDTEESTSGADQALVSSSDSEGPEGGERREQVARGKQPVDPARQGSRGSRKGRGGSSSNSPVRAEQS